ncbi:tryptophan halogenase family protein [Kordiimonas lacus]|uniref:Tryptophan halogenase n=1 Tax=Kordiimonas lacus TaxID=637679 RepID=A0A1G6ZJ11_9PROT|nr:tryptophan halogenase family protein [Kordiimonas lacus]SDE02433.1 tryptophan halogenase [Kordiimonas lacus]
MESDTRKSILVAGGGSAGWMTALYLNRLFNHAEKTVDITVVESPDIGIIGVGEATVHSVRFFFAAMGLDEAELMRETNATLKLGIMFRGWMKPVDGEMHQYFHPFEHQRLGRVLDISSMWFLSGRAATERYDEGVCLSAEMIKRGHGPKGPNTPAYQGVVPYGYHLDATLLARFLRKKAVEAGVVHVEATIDDIDVAGETITAIHTNTGQSFSADWYIDCTGFRGLLIDKVAPDNWDSFEDALPCNRAVALQRELAPGEAPNPYTVATALKNGWAWQIDLTNRQGTGYVYDGNRMTADEAEAELRDFLGPQSRVLKSTHLKMRIGCRKRFWVGNVIATGLAGGFIEPLESTGLHLINLAAGLMGTHLAGTAPTDDSRESFNRLMRGFYQDLKQFIVLHYCLTNRDDTAFWRAAPQTVEHTPWLKAQLEVWKHKVCEYHDLAGAFSTTFTDENYRYILYGMQHTPTLGLVADGAESDRMFSQLRQMQENACALTMTHADYLAKLNGTAEQNLEAKASA